MSESYLERLMAFHIKAAGLPEPEREYRFLQGRTFRFDFAWPEQRLALEVEGGIWLNGRHTRGAGFQTDCWKYNEAAAGGWRVLRVTEELITNGMAVKWLERMMGKGDKSLTTNGGDKSLTPDGEVLEDE